MPKRRTADQLEMAFRMIEDVMVPVIIPASIKAYEKDPSAVQRTLDYATSAGGIGHAVQRHLVQIPRSARGKLIAAKAAIVLRSKEFGDQFVQLTNDAIYTADAGLKWDDPTFREIESNMF